MTSPRPTSYLRAILNCLPKSPHSSRCHAHLTPQVISLFNIENEHLGIVRNLVGVGLGIKVRVGVQPAASDAEAFLVRINDRVVGLIEDLDRREQKARQSEAERKLALGPMILSPARNKNENRKRSVFARLTSLSPSSRSRKSLTPPLIPTSPERQQSEGLTPVLDNRGVGLQHLLEGNRTAKERDTGASVSQPNVANVRRRKRQGEPPSTPSLFLPESFGSQQLFPSDFLRSAPVLLHSYAKLLNALVCGSYNLRDAYFSSCEVDVRNIGRPGGYLDMLAGMDGGTPRLVFRQIAVYLHEILVECHF